ncbi:hypothetical protein [Scytonema sp. NUACC26]|uniref:hypothetical protein n=1 Tax=Scytonema sp. NUACC26 TaxID=3140176 RepID=UPI0034DBC9DE
MANERIEQTSHDTTITATVETNLSQALDLILNENTRVLKTLNYGAIAQLIQAILNTKRIFVEGEGRSGFAIRMAAMRLMHLGLQDYVVGETTTPSIEKGDLLIACSGSGRLLVRSKLLLPGLLRSLSHPSLLSPGSRYRASLPLPDENAQQVLELLIETALENGESLPNPKTLGQSFQIV